MRKMNLLSRFSQFHYFSVRELRQMIPAWDCVCPNAPSSWPSGSWGACPTG